MNNILNHLNLVLNFKVHWFLHLLITSRTIWIVLQQTIWFTNIYTAITSRRANGNWIFLPIAWPQLMVKNFIYLKPSSLTCNNITKFSTWSPLTCYFDFDREKNEYNFYFTQGQINSVSICTFFYNILATTFIYY